MLDVNAWIDCCLAVNSNEVARPAWWLIDDQPSRPLRGAGLIAALGAKLTQEVSVVVDEKLLDVVYLKLCQPRRAERRSKEGLGFSTAAATAAMDEVTSRIGPRAFMVTPPAGEGFLEGHHDPEDRRVWGLFETALGRFPERRGWFVLTDREFQERAAAAATPRFSDGKPAYLATPPVNFIRAMFHYRAVD